MCGICGSLKFGGLSGEDKAAILKLTKLMERRGPDDEGFWSDDRNCTLGFRRLTILDLTPAGHQPMTTADGRYTLVYNGEAYNFPELRTELQQQGIKFCSTGDTEVVLQTLAMWGEESLKRFNGMFALGFYDAVRRRLLLARDHAGIKPLYYLLGAKGVVFASQYDQIMAHPWAEPLKVSRDAMALYVRLGYIPAPYAALESTHMLEPGTWLAVDVEGKAQGGRFFEFPLNPKPDLHGEEAYEAVNEAVLRAVRRHLVSDVPLGAFLSGGIDSPLVAAKMKAVDSGPVRAFTIGTNGDALDESSDAAVYARELGVEHLVEHVTPDFALELLDDVISACGEPFADYSVFPTMLVARLARRHVKVMLSGDGGDELFWGYPSRSDTLIKYAVAFGEPHWLRSLRWLSGRFFGNGISELRYPSIGDSYLAKHSRISEGDLRKIFPRAPEWPADFELFRYGEYDPDATAQWLRWNEFVSHLTMVLLKVDRASMHESLEVRVPLLDREVIDVAGRVDWRSCTDSSLRIGKIPLRKALARHVQHQTHSKRGFEVPMNSWLRGPLKSVFEDSVMTRKDILGMEIDKGELGRLMLQHSTGRQDHARALWTLLSLALWERHHYQGSRCAPVSTAPPWQSHAVA